MYFLRPLSIRDVGRALQRRELALAVRISENLGSNALNTVCFRLRTRFHLLVRPAAGRKS